ncbi:fluoride efflux transporter CrcB [Cohnella candidum]|uniref:Fluoride-specific ion channel FluC n=1 Tax=Cohnella candidum TaxID=2674991 RepID=A0A3G3K302_9BACL|nr:fluoride efflux transporter CrcB [Cohnella candidum]AYQ74551.1 fluoride efflux transporter CrcB [Cohnella candidum]
MILWIGIGGIAGAFARYYLGKWVASKSRSTFPFGTFLINISGSFVLGLLYALHANTTVPSWAWFVFGSGFCGAYTTFSTFGYETVQLIEQKRWGLAAAYVAGSVVTGLLLAWAGMIIVG